MLPPLPLYVFDCINLTCTKYPQQPLANANGPLISQTISSPVANRTTQSFTPRSAVGVDCLDRSGTLGGRLPAALPPCVGGAGGNACYGVRDTDDDDVHVRRQRLHACLRHGIVGFKSRS